MTCDCGRPLRSLLERRRGECAKCSVASWSPEKRAALYRLVTARPAAEVRAAYDAAMRVV